MIEAIMKAISEFIQRILPNSEKALFKEKKRYVEKQNREYIKNQYRRIFAEADIDELNLINKLITNNNMPVKTLWEIPAWEVSHKGITEHFFQIIKEDVAFGSVSDDEYTIRITATIFNNVKREFKKHGKVRIPDGYGESNK